MSDEDRRRNALVWATNTCAVGEDAMAILARAQLFEEYIVNGATAVSPVAHS